MARGALGYVVIFLDWDWATAKRELELAIELAPTEVLGYHYPQFSSLSWVMLPVPSGRFGPVDDRIRWVCGPISSTLPTCCSAENGTRRSRRDRHCWILASVLLADFVGIASWLEEEFDRALDIWREHHGAASPWYEALEAGCQKAGPEGGMLAIAKLHAAGEPMRVNPMEVAVYYSAAGQANSAFEWLDKAFEARTPQLLHLTFHPLLDPIRNDPRFADLVRQIGISQ